MKLCFLYFSPFIKFSVLKNKKWSDALKKARLTPIEHYNNHAASAAQTKNHPAHEMIF